MTTNRAGWTLCSVATLALLGSMAPLGAQTPGATAAGTPGTPPRQSSTGTPTSTGTSTTVTINPKAVINKIGGIFKKKPKPVPTPVPTPTPTPVPTPATISKPVVQAIPTSKPVAKPAPRPVPRPVAIQTPAKPVIKRPVAAVVIAAPPVVPSESATPIEAATIAPSPPPAPLPIPAPVEPGKPLWWPWLAALFGAVGLGELARRWFKPTPQLACKFETRPSELTGWSSPAIGPPEVDFNVSMNVGVSSGPQGVSIQSMGTSS